MANDFDFETPQGSASGVRIDYKKVFFNPEEGTNLIRVVALKNGKKFKSHFCKDTAGGKKFVKCPGAGCPLCIEGTNKPTTRYFLKVIDRKTNVVKVWEFGSQIKTQIDEFVADIKKKITNGETDPNDSLMDYNIEIRKRKPGTNPLYMLVMRERLVGEQRYASTLTNDDSAMVADTINLDDLIKPWTNDRIKQQILGTLAPSEGMTKFGDDRSRPQSVVYSSTPAPVVAPPVVTAAPVKVAPKEALKAASQSDTSWLDD